MSVNNFNSTFVFKLAFHANPGADKKKQAGSSSYVSIHLFRKFPNTSASDNVSLWMYKSWSTFVTSTFVTSSLSSLSKNSFFKIVDYMNHQHPNTKFTLEFEKTITYNF